MRRVCVWGVLHRAEVPKYALPCNPWQEGAMVLALEPSHKICALTPGIPEVAGSDGKAKRRAG